MTTYVITHATIPSVTPFRVKAPDADTALQRVREYMGSDNYKVIAAQPS